MKIAGGIRHISTLREPEPARITPVGRQMLSVGFPPSANRYWRHKVIRTAKGPQVQTYVSKEAKDYKRDVEEKARAAGIEMVEGDVILRLDVYRPRKAGDLSNRIKVLEDSLQGIAYHDDNQVVQIIARRFDSKENPRVELWIETPITS